VVQFGRAVPKKRMAFKIKKGLSASQRRKRDSTELRGQSRWIIVVAALAFLGFSLTQFARMGIFEGLRKSLYLYAKAPY